MTTTRCCIVQFLRKGVDAHMNIYLLRHGETDWNRAGRLQGHTDIALNDTGRIQMQHAGEILGMLDEKIDLILSSPLSRARESAGIVARQLGYPGEEILVEDMLIERFFGKGEGLTAAERKEKYPNDIFPEMESYEQVIGRARVLFGKIVRTYQDKDNILLVAHGAILYAVMAGIAEGQFAYIGDAIIREQGNVYRIRYSSDKLEMSRYSRDKAVFEDVDTYTGSVVD